MRQNGASCGNGLNSVDNEFFCHMTIFEYEFSICFNLDQSKILSSGNCLKQRTANFSEHFCHTLHHFFIPLTHYQMTLNEEEWCAKTHGIEQLGLPTYSKVLSGKVWGLQWDQNTPITEVLSPIENSKAERFKGLNVILYTKQHITKLWINKIHFLKQLTENSKKVKSAG